MFKFSPFHSLIFLIFLTPACRKEAPLPTVLPERTVIIYMSANNNLEEYAYENINQMEAGIKDPNHNLLVYLNAPGGPPKVLKISPDKGTEIVSKEVISYPAQNSANPEVFKTVLN